MARIARPLRSMGAHVDGRAGGTLAPLAIRGGDLRPADHDLAVASAQVKSALLLAGRRSGVRVREPARSRDHSERLLRAMGARLDEGADGWLALAPGPLEGVDVAVPGDLSAAAFPLVAAALIPGSELVIPGVGVNPTRSGVLDALRLMGADLTVVPRGDSGGEPVADLVIRHGPLRGATIAGELALRSLDELVVLAVAAAFAEGPTTIADAAELRVKESDRIARVAAGLRALGAGVEERPDGLVVAGGGPRPTGVARVDATHDHRIAMAFTVASLALGGGVHLEGADAVASSWPTFHADLAAVSSAPLELP
jgi:3-phosphoshikimate 1-carboxyvinyltransferase